MNTSYWSKKQLFFSRRCDEQKSRADGRQLRKYTNPQTNEPGEVWEYQQSQFAGLVESFYIEQKEVEASGRKFKIHSINLGLQDTQSGQVNVLQFKVTDQKGGLTNDFITIAKKIAGIDFTKELYVDIWENHKGAKKQDDGTFKTPVYLMFKHDVGEKWPKSYPHTFQYDEENKKWIGMPEVVKTESFAGTKYDTSERDAFLYKHVEDVLKKNETIFAAHKAARPQSDAEKEAGVVNEVPKVPAVPGGDLEEDPPF